MRTMITAHSGAENTQDNSLESIRCLAALGADALEVDVCLSGGEIVLSHDSPAEGAARLEDGLRIAEAQPGLWVNADIKTPDIAAAVITAAESCGMAGRMLITGDVLTPADFAAAARAGVPVWYNHTQVAPGTPLLKGARDAGFDVLNVNYRLITEEMLPEGAGISAWTVNDEESLRMLLRAGVRNITTRQPKTALRLRDEIQGE